MKDFEKLCCRTESKPDAAVLNRLCQFDTVRLLHAGMGMSTEGAGEFIDQMKKHIFYGAPLDKINLMEEMADLLWYIGIGCDVLKCTVEELMTLVIVKLKFRYPAGFTDGDALKRNLVGERMVLESGKLDLAKVFEAIQRGEFSGERSVLESIEKGKPTLAEDKCETHQSAACPIRPQADRYGHVEVQTAPPIGKAENVPYNRPAGQAEAHAKALAGEIKGQPNPEKLVPGKVLIQKYCPNCSSSDPKIRNSVHIEDKIDFCEDEWHKDAMVPGKEMGHLEREKEQSLADAQDAAPSEAYRAPETLPRNWATSDSDNDAE